MYCWIFCFPAVVDLQNFSKYLSDILLHNDVRCHTSVIGLAKCIYLLFIDKGEKTTVNRKELQPVMKIRS